MALAFPAGKRLTGSCPLGVVKRHWESIGASVASDGSPALRFAKTVSFTTRTHEDQEVTRITWHSTRLPEMNSTVSELGEAILDCVDVETLPGSDYPVHFFEVEVGGRGTSFRRAAPQS